MLFTLGKGLGVSGSRGTVGSAVSKWGSTQSSVSLGWALFASFSLQVPAT